MNKKTLRLTLLTVTPAALLAFTSCSSSSSSAPKVQPTTVVAAQPGVPGGAMVDTYQGTATVTAIDAEKRKVTLTTPDGRKETFTAGPEVVNFPQIKVGDQVKATLTQALVVYMATDAPPQPQGEAAVVSFAPTGAKPGALLANTVQIKAKVTAIDLEHRKATLQFPDGSTHQVNVRKDVDLTQRKVGEEVVIRTTDALAITVEKP
jgi:hypothetical protein